MAVIRHNARHSRSNILFQFQTSISNHLEVIFVIGQYLVDSSVAACCLQFGTFFCPFCNVFISCCDLLGRKINFTNSKTSVGGCRDRQKRSCNAVAFLFIFPVFVFCCLRFFFILFVLVFFAVTKNSKKKKRKIKETKEKGLQRGPPRDGSKKFFFTRNVARNRAAIEAKKNQNKSEDSAASSDPDPDMPLHIMNSIGRASPTDFATVVAPALFVPLALAKRTEVDRAQDQTLHVKILMWRCASRS